MTEFAKAVIKIAVTLEDREDGGLRVHSRDVPGLHLSGADKARVWAMIGPAVKALLKANRGLDVLKVYYPEASPEGVSPRNVAVDVEHELSFMLELAA